MLCGHVMGPPYRPITMASRLQPSVRARLIPVAPRKGTDIATT